MTQPPRGFNDRFVRRNPDVYAIKSGTTFAGKVTLSSGSTAVDVVYAGFQSTDLFLSLVPVLSSISAISSRCGALGITSTVPGTGFSIGWAGGVAYAADVVVHWVIGKTA